MTKPSLIYHHLGLGDHVICNGLVREKAVNGPVILFAKPHNVASVSHMYLDLPQLKVVPVQNDQAADALMDEFRSRGIVGVVEKIGFSGLEGHSGASFDQQFYAMAGVPFHLKWEAFRLARCRERELGRMKMDVPAGPYAFVHEDASRGMRLCRGVNELKKVRPSELEANSITDYCGIIEGAAEVHVIDSCFLSLVDCMDYAAPGQKLFFHQYARYEADWLAPVLRKNWEILKA